MRERLGKIGPSALVRAACGGLLLLLLAVCGYAGASRTQSAQAVSVPVTQRTITGGELAAATAQQVREKLVADREAEIALLDSVIADASASMQTRDSALAQKAQIAGRMENEAQIEAALYAMGCAGTSAVCGAQTVTVITPEQNVGGEAEKTRLIGAVCAQTGLSAENVKIILIKK